MLLLIIPFTCPFFFLSNKTFHHRILHSYYSQSSNFVYTLRGANFIVGKKTKILWLIFAFFFHFSFFSISHSNVIHREICVKDFSGTTVPRILKLGTNVGYNLSYCVKENQHAAAYHYPHLSIFLSYKANFLLHIFQLLWEPESSNFVYTLRVAKYIVGQKTKLWFILPYFSFFLSLTPM